MVALSEAANDGVPVIGGGEGDMPEYFGGVREAAGGGGGAEIEEFRAGEGMGLEKAGGYEVSLELFDVGKGRAFL